MLITLEEAKEYLKVEYEDEDTLIQTLINLPKYCVEILYGVIFCRRMLP